MEQKDILGADIEIDANTNISIGIVFYQNSDKEVETVLSGIRRSIDVEGIKINILCINNGDPLSEVALESLKRYDAIELPSDGNVGSARGHNKLMERAFEDLGAHAYITMNPDGTLHPEALSRMIKMLQRHNYETIIEAAQFPLENSKVYNLKTFDTKWAVTACAAFPKVCWDKIGGFDENIFLYCDDVDYSWQARLAGISIKLCPWALFYHDFAGERESAVATKYRLLGGRYLAHKWQNMKFKQQCETDLITNDFYKSVEDMPLLSDDCIIENTENVPDFSRNFYFSKSRW